MLLYIQNRRWLIQEHLEIYLKNGGNLPSVQCKITNTAAHVVLLFLVTRSHFENHVTMTIYLANF